MPIVGLEHTTDTLPLRGTRGDGVPWSDIVLRLPYGEPVDKADFTVLSQLREAHGSAVVAHEFDVELEDHSDDSSIDEHHLKVTLRKLTGAETQAMPHRKYVGDVQVTKAGSEPATILSLVLRLDPDVSRNA